MWQVSGPGRASIRAANSEGEKSPAASVGTGWRPKEEPPLLTILSRHGSGAVQDVELRNALLNTIGLFSLVKWQRSGQTLFLEPPGTRCLVALAAIQTYSLLEKSVAGRAPGLFAIDRQSQEMAIGSQNASYFPTWDQRDAAVRRDSPFHCLMRPSTTKVRVCRLGDEGCSCSTAMMVRAPHRP